MRAALWRLSLLFSVMALIGGCAAQRPKPKFIYSPNEFRAELARRVPEIPPGLGSPPFEVSAAAADLARTEVEKVPPGPARVHALLALLQKPRPDGFGLRYHWTASATANRTLETRLGNCISLASVLVGLGRELAWPIYYAVARDPRYETHELESISVVADHMVVVVAPKSFQLVIDFTGEVDATFRLRAIDDLSAHAHFVNNLAAGVLVEATAPLEDSDWQRALEGFELAVRIDPDLARAWNNQGIALSRLGRVQEARQAYARALRLDPALASATHNLTILETRAAQGAWAAEARPLPEGSVERTNDDAE